MVSRTDQYRPLIKILQNPDYLSRFVAMKLGLLWSSDGQDSLVPELGDTHEISAGDVGEAHVLVQQTQLAFTEADQQVKPMLLSFKISLKDRRQQFSQLPDGNTGPGNRRIIYLVEFY